MKAILDHQSEKTGHTTITTELSEKPEISFQLQDMQEQVHVIRYAWAPVVEKPQSSEEMGFEIDIADIKDFCTQHELCHLSAFCLTQLTCEH